MTKQVKMIKDDSVKLIDADGEDRIKALKAEGWKIEADKTEKTATAGDSKKADPATDKKADK